jgi:hypothetical protein
MVKCPFCHATHVDNTIFCSECGNYLLQDDKRETDPLDLDETGWMGETTDVHGIVSPFQHQAGPRTIRLKIGDSKREVEVLLDKVIHLGRVDPASNVFPEVDLTRDDPLAKSISRRHIRILKQGDMVVVEDLGSINGTFINGKRLDPYLPELIADGDKLQLGRLLIEVKIPK